MYRCRLENNDRRLHCQPSDGQVDPSCRYHLVLPFRLGSRHTGRGRYRTVPARHVCHAQRQAPDHADGRRHLPGDLLRQQGPPEVNPSPTPFLLPDPGALADVVAVIVPDSLSPAGTSDMAARSIPFPWVVHYTSNPTPSAVPVRRTSMDTVTQTGKRAWRSPTPSNS